MEETMEYTVLYHYIQKINNNIKYVLEDIKENKSYLTFRTYFKFYFIFYLFSFMNYYTFYKFISLYIICNNINNYSSFTYNTENIVLFVCLHNPYILPYYIYLLFSYNIYKSLNFKNINEDDEFKDDDLS